MGEESVKKIAIIDSDGNSSVHLCGSGGEGYTLCGYSMDEFDSEVHAEEPTETKSKVTCDLCWRIIEHVRRFKGKR